MKLRPLFILLLFVAASACLGWLYHAATRRGSRKNAVPRTETIADLDVCCRQKHVRAAQYALFAETADCERRPDAARLFRALAQAERIHEANCARAIVQLGGSYAPPSRVVVFNGTTDSNLERSIAAAGVRAADERSGADIRRALLQGNRYAARALAWSTAAEMQHALLLRCCRACGAADTAGRYLLCPYCGNVCAEEPCIPFCPHCLTERLQFLSVE